MVDESTVLALTSEEVENNDAGHPRDGERGQDKEAEEEDFDGEKHDPILRRSKPGTPRLPPRLTAHSR